MLAKVRISLGEVLLDIHRNEYAYPVCISQVPASRCTRSLRTRGRDTAEHPVAPARVRACGIPAPGSSVILTGATAGFDDGRTAPTATTDQATPPTGDSAGRLREPRRVPSDVVPGSPGIHEDVHADLHARIAIDAAQRDAVHHSFMSPAQRRATDAAETEPPPRSRLVSCQFVLTLDPPEGSRRNLRVRRSRTAERLSAARAMTAPRIEKRRVRCIPDPTAETPAGNRHDASRCQRGECPTGAAKGQAATAVVASLGSRELQTGVPNLRALVKITSPTGTPIHPGWLRCSSVE